MSNTQAATTYSFFYELNNGTIIEFGMNQSASFNDAAAFAFYNAMLAVFPTSMSATGSVAKSDESVTNYTTNLTATPPSFT